MFTRELVDTTKFPDAAAASADAFSALVTIVATLCSPTRVEEVSLAAWCIVHGYATLCNETDLEAPSLRSRRIQQFTSLILGLDAVAIKRE